MILQDAVQISLGPKSWVLHLFFLQTIAQKNNLRNEISENLGGKINNIGWKSELIYQQGSNIYNASQMSIFHKNKLSKFQYAGP